MKVVLVNYYNTRPFLYGLREVADDCGLELIEAVPSQCAELFLNGKVDVGLVPIGSLFRENAYIFSDYCIGCNGAVQSVGIYSHIPLENTTAIYLDYQSRTSNKLAKILVEEYFHFDLNYMESRNGYEKHMEDNHASVIIGDRTVQADRYYKYKYDMGEYWKKLTGLPFSFACWVTQNPLDQHIREAFNKAFRIGMNKIDEIIQGEKDAPFDLNSYYKDAIDYTFNEKKKRALELFYRKCSAESPVIL